ncbi:MAG: hypothetical protein ACHQQQ_12175 [Bacteroidota bacterium]
MPPTRIWLAAVMFFMILTRPIYSQHMNSSRGIGIGALTALSDDEHSIDWNPAGLSNIHEWEFSLTSFTATSSQLNLAFQSAGIGYAFTQDQAAALRISPGIELQFTIPSTFTLQDSLHSLNTTFDKKITYDEAYSGGYAYSVSKQVSVGLSFHAIEQKITDTEYFIDTTGIIRSTLVDYTSRIFTFDMGAAWLITPWLNFGAVVKNAFHISGAGFPESLTEFELAHPAGIRGGLAFGEGDNSHAEIDYDDRRNLRIGGEWNITDVLKGRGGMYIDNSSPTFVDAIGLGVGAELSRVKIDLGYLKFTSQTNRKGSADISLLDQLNVNNLEYNVFTGDRISLTASFRLGSTRENLMHIEYADLTQEIFPAARTMYALSPVGKTRVRNISSKPIEAKVSFFIDHLMDGPTVTPPVTIQPGEVEEIPFYAVINDVAKVNSGLSIQDGELTVSGEDSRESEDRYQIRVLVHGKNDWNGDVHLLRFFVTPDDSDVLSFTRNSINNHKAELDTVPAVLTDFSNARILFNDFAARLTYVHDPKTSQDNVQYPAETLRLRGGDCDDMTVTYSTMLSSVGISVAFVDVVPPDHPGDAHIYMLFDSGLPPKDASLIGTNQKRFVIRKNDSGNETIWIPVETTVITKGFDEAWNAGASEYFNDVEVNLGIVKGWVKIVDLEIAQ